MVLRSSHHDDFRPGPFYLLEMTDMWTDVFASPGVSTTGTEEQPLALADPGWQGELPPGVDLIRTPTATGWIIGRTQTNGAADYDNVHKFQAGLNATPLSAWGKDYTPPPLAVNPELDMKTPPLEQVDKLSPEAFFALFAELTKANPAHANDYPPPDAATRDRTRQGFLDAESVAGGSRSGANPAGQRVLNGDDVQREAGVRRQSDQSVCHRRPGQASRRTSRAQGP
jgi:hypothetical protein